MDNETLSKNIFRIGMATFVLSLVYGIALHAPYIWWVTLS